MENGTKTDWGYIAKYAAGLLALVIVLYFMARYIIPIVWALLR